MGYTRVTKNTRTSVIRKPIFFGFGSVFLVSGSLICFPDEFLRSICHQFSEASKLVGSRIIRERCLFSVRSYASTSGSVFSSVGFLPKHSIILLTTSFLNCAASSSSSIQTVRESTTRKIVQVYSLVPNTRNFSVALLVVRRARIPPFFPMEYLSALFGQLRKYFILYH